MSALGTRLASLLAGSGHVSLEDMLTSPEWFGLETATAMQRVICRVADGLPLGELATGPLLDNAPDYDEEIQKRLSLEHALFTTLDGEVVGSPEDLPDAPPREVGLIAGIRGGKSLITAAKAVQASQTVSVEPMREGEWARVPVLSLSKDNARAVYGHIAATIETSPRLASLVLEMKDGEQVRSVVLRHPSGTPVEIRIVAGRRAGGGLISHWCAAVIFDEAPRMLGEDDAVINFEDAYKAVKGRVLPGGQVWWIGSPHAAIGPVYRLAEVGAGRPSSSRVVIRSVAPAMFPGYWTPEQVAHVRSAGHDEQAEKTAEEVYQTDVLGEFLGELDTAWFSFERLKQCTRNDNGEPLADEPGHHYVAAIDPATRRNAWTLAIADQAPGGVRRIVYTTQWQGEPARPLSPDAVFRQIADIIEPYGIDTLITDQWAADALRDIANRYAIGLSDETLTGVSKQQLFADLATLMDDGKVSLPNERTVLDDLKRTRRKLTTDGVRVEFQRTADGRHCDFAPCIAMAIAAAVQGPTPLEPELDPGQEAFRQEVERRERLRQGDMHFDPDMGLFEEDWLEGVA